MLPLSNISIVPVYPVTENILKTAENLDSYNVCLKDFLDTAEGQLADIAELLKNYELTQNLYSLPENLEKNRLPCKVFPYDNNFVSSKSVKYINGSELFFPEISPFSYIATQAPLETTIQDLFTVMEEKGSHTLISLVMPVELRKQPSREYVLLNRCADFWSKDLKFENGYTLLTSTKEPEIIAFDHTNQSLIIRKLVVRNAADVNMKLSKFTIKIGLIMELQIQWYLTT